MLRPATLALIIFWLTSSAYAHEFTGKVTRVIDGDTIDVRDGATTRRVRLLDIVVPPCWLTMVVRPRITRWAVVDGAAGRATSPALEVSEARSLPTPGSTIDANDDPVVATTFAGVVAAWPVAFSSRTAAST